jgi:hypothetical protein
MLYEVVVNAMSRKMLTTLKQGLRRSIGSDAQFRPSAKVFTPHPFRPKVQMANPRNGNDANIKARQSVAGRFGFILGCVAAVAAAALNLFRLPRPWDTTSAMLAVLMAALNIPLGIAFGLLGERLSRP